MDYNAKAICIISTIAWQLLIYFIGSRKGLGVNGKQIWFGRYKFHAIIIVLWAQFKHKNGEKRKCHKI